MGYICIKNSHEECDGCMACKEETHYYCPNCGKEVFETLYVDNHREILGCENCVEIKEVEEILEDEAI